MSVSIARPEVPLQVITPADVRASVKRARKGLEAAAEEIVWQVEMEAWRTLGYSSWTAMREAEYGGAAFMVPSKSRPEIVARIKETEVGRSARGNPKHLTDQEIAETVGVSKATIENDLGARSKTRKSTDSVDPDDDVLDAEVVEPGGQRTTTFDPSLIGTVGTGNQNRQMTALKNAAPQLAGIAAALECGFPGGYERRFDPVAAAEYRREIARSVEQIRAVLDMLPD